MWHGSRRYIGVADTIPVTRPKIALVLVGDCRGEGSIAHFAELAGSLAPPSGRIVGVGGFRKTWNVH